MRTVVLMLVCCLMFFQNGATDPGARAKILIVGFSHSYFSSNSFESLAKGNNIEDDSIFELVNHKIRETFAGDLNPNFEYVFVEDVRNLSEEVQTSIYYVSPVAGSDMTTIKIGEADIKRLCEFYDADIIMFINSYELNWEDEPYVAFAHTFDSEVFIKSGKRIDVERVSFMTEDVKLSEKYSNKLSRLFGRMLKKLEKIDIKDDALVNMR